MISVDDHAIYTLIYVLPATPRPLSYNPHVRLRWRWCMRAARTLWCARPRWLGFWRYHHLFSTTAPLLVVLILFSSLLFVPRLYIVILSIHLCCAAMDLPFFCSCNSLISTQCTVHISCTCAYCARQCKPKHPFLNKQLDSSKHHPSCAVNSSFSCKRSQAESGQEDW